MENAPKRAHSSESSKRTDLTLDDANKPIIVSGDSVDPQPTSEAVIENLKDQIESFRAENQDLRSYKECSQEIIRNLNNDVGHYRLLLIIKSNAIVEQKIDYDKTIKLLDGTIKMCKTEISNKSAIIAKLHEEQTEKQKQPDELEQHIDACEEVTNDMAALQTKLQESDFIIAELRQTIETSHCIIAEYTEREKILLQKLQEAVAIRTEAWRNQIEAGKQEVSLQENCENYANPEANISQTNQMAEVTDETTAMETGTQQSREYLKARCRLYECKYNEALKEIAKQRENLKQTANALAMVERKMIETESRMRDNTLAVEYARDSEYEIHHFIIKNRQLQGKYKATIEQARRMYESEIVRLNRENSELKAEMRNMYMENNSLIGRY